jgi:hypothetical protein
MKKVFKVEKNFTCGSHVHVAPKGRHYTLPELKIIAFAIITHEHLLDAFLPKQRLDNRYCKKNSAVSVWLRHFFANGISSQTFSTIATFLRAKNSKVDIKRLMQGVERSDRYVIWNFANIENSGTIEFRGGRHLRGPNRTYWWITFAVSFISLALREVRQPAATSGSPRFYSNVSP